MIYNLKLSKRLQQYLKVFNNIRLRDMSVCISQLSAQILNLSTFHCTNGLPTNWPTENTTTARHDRTLQEKTLSATEKLLSSKKQITNLPTRLV